MGNVAGPRGPALPSILPKYTLKRPKIVQKFIKFILTFNRKGRVPCIAGGRPLKTESARISGETGVQPVGARHEFWGQNFGDPDEEERESSLTPVGARFIAPLRVGWHGQCVIVPPSGGDYYCHCEGASAPVATQVARGGWFRIHRHCEPPTGGVAIPHPSDTPFLHRASLPRRLRLLAMTTSIVACGDIVKCCRPYGFKYVTS